MFATHYAQYYDQINSVKPYRKEVEFVYKWAKKPSSIFDIGCGTASYWKHYPKSVHLVGVDRSRAMAQKAGNVINADIATYQHRGAEFDCATALFDVLNYNATLDWWDRIPLKSGGFFIFDIWDKKKVDKDGFKTSERQVGPVLRNIYPYRNGDRVNLLVFVSDSVTGKQFTETHIMYIHSHADIVKACGDSFKIVDVRPTKTWQTWYKLVKK